MDLKCKSELTHIHEYKRAFIVYHQPYALNPARLSADSALYGFKDGGAAAACDGRAEHRSQE
jgi:hypothetical protein